jgi:hypothetical protein
MMTKPIFLLIFLSILICSANHPIHLTVTNIDYVAREGKAEISMRIFRDDFGFAIGHRYNAHINLLDDAFSAEEQILIQRYIDDMFLIRQDGDTVLLHFLRIEPNNEALFLYYKADLDKQKKSLIFKNLLLMDLYADQKNLLIFGEHGKERGYEFTLDKQEIEVLWGQ